MTLVPSELVKLQGNKKLVDWKTEFTPNSKITTTIKMKNYHFLYRRIYFTFGIQ